MITKEKTGAADEMLHTRIQTWHEERDREIQSACRNAIKKPYLQKIHQWEKWTAQGIDKDLCAQICKFSRTTYYRYKQIIANIDKDILKRDYRIKLSVSTVGRILKTLFNQKLIQKSISAPKTRRP